MDSQKSGYADVKEMYLIKHERKDSRGDRADRAQNSAPVAPVENTSSEVEPEAPKAEQDTAEAVANVDVNAVDNGEVGSLKRKNPVPNADARPNHMSSKKRHQESHPSKEDRLCSFVAKGEACPFQAECKYNHDTMDYLAKKPADLGDVCYQYATFGYCNNGIMCRFGESHIDRSTGLSFRRPDSEGGVVERTSINVLRKDVQLALRKKKYDDYVKKAKQQLQTASTGSESIVDGSTAPVAAESSAPGETIPVDSTASAAPSEDLPAGAVIAEETVSAPIDASVHVSSSSATAPVAASKSAPAYSYNLSAFPDRCVKLVDFSNKVYVAPLTTVGNLPYRRIMKDFGADITCGEMAMASNLEMGQASEWALMRRHADEDVFGVQIAGNHSDMMARVGRMLEHETKTDFVDINCGCPIDVVCNRGCGSSLMNKHNKLCDIVAALAKNLPSRSITVKVRTGWDEKNPTTHKLMPLLQRCTKDRIAAIMIHGRSRLQRYSKLANWDYILQAAQAQDSSLRRIPVIGNGDIFSWEDWRERQHYMADSAVNDSDSEAKGLCSCAMLGRGALIKPWLPSEIKEQRMIDISASERLDMLKRFCDYGLEHWGSDQQGVNTTRRFLLEWLSFLHRYIPLHLLESTQKMNQRPPHYFGRCDLETLLSSQSSADWVRISELLLGPTGDTFNFIPKHKSNAYSAEAESVSNG